MYNRYIPRGDGSYICRQEPDFEHEPEPVIIKEPQKNEPPIDHNEPPRREPEPEIKARSNKGPFGIGSITESLRGILPKNVDIGDLLLIFILILLLIEGEDDEILWILLILLVL